jgi:membrane protease YdiL (CAAX protease family)
MQAWPTGFPLLAVMHKMVKSPPASDLIIQTVCVIGTVIMAIWLVRDRGPLALRNCPIRRNRLPFLLPVALIGLWMLLAGSINLLRMSIFQDATPMLQTLFFYGSLMLIYVFLIGLMLILAEQNFARGLRGFGLRIRTIPRDLASAAVNLLAVYPLVILSIAAVMAIGQYFKGAGFEFETNPALQDFKESTTTAQVIMVAIFAVVFVPIFEELMFRGMLQSTLRGYLGRPWLAIFLTAIPFALLHPGMHRPAMLILGCGFGYAYEKSGSLLRAIFFHALFNGANVLASHFGA